MCYTGKCNYELISGECGISVEQPAIIFPKDAVCLQPGFEELPIATKEDGAE